MTNFKRLTLGDLRIMVASLPDSLNRHPITAWLPGSRIDLYGEGFVEKDGELLIEGNVRSGSALSADLDVEESARVALKDWL